MLIKCEECSKDISDKALFCPNCGCPVNSSTESEKPKYEQNTKPKRGHRQRKKHKKLPNGFGSIKYLGKGRRNPYAAYPPTKEYKDNGVPVTLPAIGYYEDWYTAFDALREYNHNPYDIRSENITFAEIYQQYYSAKYENSKKNLSESSKNSTKAAFKNCSTLHDRKFMELRKSDLQRVVDGCKLKHASIELIVSLFHGMYRYAVENDITDKDYSRFVTINIPDDDETGEPFSPEELDILWKNKDVEGVDTILIMIYSGFRLSAYKTMEFNLEEKYFRGGVKTTAGKNRIVPMHPAIYDMIETYGGNTFIKTTPATYRSNVFKPALEKLNIYITASGKKHTPHDCRHTFSWLCDTYMVDDLTKHLLMGHAIKGDIEKSVYGHRTLEQLRQEICKIQV